MRLINVLVPFGIGMLVAFTADTFAQDAGLFSSDELNRTPLPGEDAIALQLQQQQRMLDNREETIERKERQLQEAEERLRGDLAESQALREEIQTLLDQLDAVHSDEIARQIKVYEKMRGSQAAPILTEMETAVVVPILRGMRADKAAKIMAAMDPAVAANLSELLNLSPIAELEQ